MFCGGEEAVESLEAKATIHMEQMKVWTQVFVSQITLEREGLGGGESETLR